MSDFHIPTPRELDEHFERRRKAGDAERMLAADGVMPEAGHFYTVTRTFSQADGSWCDSFWEVLTINGGNAFVRIHTPYEQIERFWAIADRGWYLADDAWAAKVAFGTARVPS